MTPDPKLQDSLEKQWGAENVHFVGFQCDNKIAVYQIHSCENVWERKYYAKRV